MISAIKSMFWFLVVGFFLLPSCTKETMPKSLQVKPQDYGRLPFVVGDNYTYSLYYRGMKASGYADSLADEAGPFTILVPNNDAMAASLFYYPQYNDTTNYFLQAFDPPLGDFVRYMIIPGKISFSSLPLGPDQTFTTLQGTRLYINKYLSGSDTVITVNGIKVINNAKDLPASNGYIDVITAVPEPQVYPNLWQRMLKDGSLAFFTTAAKRAGLQSFFETPGLAITVLAPSNYGFTQFLGPENNLPNLYSIDSIQAADPAILSKVVMAHILKGRYFVNDLIRADSLAGDTALLPTYNGGIVRYTQQQFYSNALTRSQAYGQNPFTGVYGFGPYGPDIVPLVASFYGEFNQGPPVYFQNRPTGNGVLHEIDNILLP